MNEKKNRRMRVPGIPLMVWVIGLVAVSSSELFATAWDPMALDYFGRKGKTLYVSKLGDNSDGSSWQKAFHTIQAGLSAVPDDKGGHRVIVRPDRYVEANLAPAHPGAAGAYNVLIGDFDGGFGSGAAGWVLIDSGDPEKGFKSWDWWGTIRATDKNWPTGNKTGETFSAIVCDRWIFRDLYATGGDAGMFWDLADKSGQGFTVIVEDCVGIGRAFGGGVCYPVVRPGEPSAFRRCYFLSLDFIGDTAAVLVGGWEKTMPDDPHVVLEDCTMVNPDNAVAMSYAAHCTRAKFVNCRLIALNFTQPEMGGKSTGIICTQGHSPTGRLHVDLEDCILAGYSVLTPGKDAEAASITTRGKVQAYVQFKQPVPQGFKQLGLWPTELFAQMAPPKSPEDLKAKPRKSPLTKIPVNFGPAMENTPVIYRGKPLLVYNFRDDSKNKTGDHNKDMFLRIQDLCTGDLVAKFGEGHSFANAFVSGDQLHVFASEGTDNDWFKSIYHFTSTDLKTWTRQPAIPLEGDEHLFNCSVCRDDQGYVMAYESNKPVQFCFRFARSKDLSKWDKIPDLTFTGANKEYSACPVIRYFTPYYYVLYVHEAIPGHNGWITFMARSKDLAAWQLSPLNPILEAAEGEGSNNSDTDLFEWEGNTYLFYATGDQQTWGSVRVAMYPGSMKSFYECCFPAGETMIEVSAK